MPPSVLVFGACLQIRLQELLLFQSALIPIFDGVIVIWQAGLTMEPTVAVPWATSAFLPILVELLRRGK